jgi:hypothetical protein
MSERFDKLVALLKELFQLDQPDLDFGFYRVMHDKSAEITKFLEQDLLPQVKAAFAEYQPANKAAIERDLGNAIGQAQALGADAAISGLFANAGVEAPNSVGHMLYKVLSWDEHHVMATGLSIGMNPTAPGFGTVLRQNAPENPEEFLPLVAAMLLDGMSKAYRTCVLSMVSTTVEPAT